MCVSEGHVDVRVSQNLLERQEVSSLDHVIVSERVSQIVRADLQYSGLFGSVLRLRI